MERTKRKTRPRMEMMSQSIYWVSDTNYWTSYWNPPYHPIQGLFQSLQHPVERILENHQNCSSRHTTEPFNKSTTYHGIDNIMESQGRSIGSIVERILVGFSAANWIVHFDNEDSCHRTSIEGQAEVLRNKSREGMVTGWPSAPCHSTSPRGVRHQAAHGRPPGSSVPGVGRAFPQHWHTLLPAKTLLRGGTTAR